MPRRGKSWSLILLVAACSRPPPSQAPAASEAAASVVPEIAVSPRTVADEVAAAPTQEETWPEGHAALRAWLAGHPGEVPSVTTMDDVTLILLRGETAATLCIVMFSAERCYRTSTAVHAARLMVPEEDDRTESPVRAWLKLDGAIYRVDEEGAVQPGGRPPRGFWAKVGVQRSRQGPRRGALTLQEVPAEDLPIAALVEVESEESTSLAGPVLTADELLCVQVDDAWRCGASPFAEMGDARPRLLAPVRGSSGVALPIEVEVCASGSELTDCTRSLHLFAVVGPELREAANLQLGAEIDERARDRDDDDRGGWIAGTRETYRRRYTVETPTCVRLTRTERTHEAYSIRFRDSGGAHKKRRKLPLAEISATAPNELPRSTELDAYADPPDLGGLWQLRGERWLRVDACDP